MKNLDEILNTLDDSDIGYFVEVDLKYPNTTKEKTKNFPFAPEIKIILKDKYNTYMKKIKPENYTNSKKLICDWTDKRNYLVDYSMLKFYVGHGMVVEKIHDLFSFKQSKWLEKYKNFDKQKRVKAENDLEKDFYKFFRNASYGKTMGNVCNRFKKIY